MSMILFFLAENRVRVEAAKLPILKPGEDFKPVKV
jgi:hypothetical protein